MTEQEALTISQEHSDLHVRLASLLLRLIEQVANVEARLAECERLLNLTPRKPNHDQQLV